MVLIGITLDDVLRDFSNKFMDLYKQQFPDKKIDETNFSPYQLSYYFESVQEGNDFLYSEVVLELFGFANETYKGVVSELNKINEIVNDMGFELMIISCEYDKSITASLYFLQKTFCKLNKYIFIQSNDEIEYFKHIDYLVTTNSNYFSNPNTIKIERNYNINDDCSLVIKEIKHLPQLLEKQLKTI